MFIAPLLDNMEPLEGGDISIEHFLRDQEDFSRGSLQPMFQDSVVLLTGATGLVGSLVLEKLLRTCAGVARVYVTVRGLGHVTADQRLSRLLSTKVFDKLRVDHPEALTKVELLDLDLGLESHVTTVTSSVTMVLHCALVTDAGHSLQEAVDTNLRQTTALLRLAHSCRLLESFVVVSSTLCHSQGGPVGRPVVEERFYPPPITAEAMLVLCDTLSQQTRNTDTTGLIVAESSASLTTLAIMEDLVRSGRKDLPVAMVRPSMLVASYREPLAGWLPPGPRGVMRAVTQAMRGRLCSLRSDVSLAAELTPVDLAASLVLIVAAHTAHARRNWVNKEVEVPPEPGQVVADSDVPIFNLVSSNHSPVSWREFFVCSIRHARSAPFLDTAWYPHLLFTRSQLWFRVWFFLLHLLPALLVDALHSLLDSRAQHTINNKKSRVYDKYLSLRGCCEDLAMHSMTSHKYRDDNTKTLWASMSMSDRASFNFHPSQVDWSQYLHTLARGVRLYCVGDSLDTVPRAVRLMNRLKLLHYGCVVFTTFISLIAVRLVIKMMLF